MMISRQSLEVVQAKIQGWGLGGQRRQSWQGSRPQQNMDGLDN